MKKNELWLVFGNVSINFFKLCMVIVITEFYILILVWVTLTYMQGHCGMRNQSF